MLWCIHACDSDKMGVGTQGQGGGGGGNLSIGGKGVGGKQKGYIALSTDT